VGGQESGSKGGGVDIVEACLDVQAEGGDLQSGSLDGFYLLCEGEAGVGGAEFREGATLVWVEEALGFGDGRQPDCHHPLKDLRDGFEKDNDAEGGGGVVGGLAGFIQDYSIGGFQRWGVVPTCYQGGEEFLDDRRVDIVYLFPDGVGDPIGARSRRGGALGEGESNLLLGEGGWWRGSLLGDLC